MGYYFAEQELFEDITESTGAINCRYPLTYLLEAADDIAYSFIHRRKLISCIVFNSSGDKFIKQKIDHISRCYLCFVYYLGFENILKSYASQCFRQRISTGYRHYFTVKGSVHNALIILCESIRCTIKQLPLNIDYPVLYSIKFRIRHTLFLCSCILGFKHSNSTLIVLHFCE